MNGRASAPMPCLSVQQELAGKRILLIGATGFLGKVVMEKIIRAVPDVGELTLLVREERGAGAAERFAGEIAVSSVFDRLRAERPVGLARFFAEKVHCVTGDLTLPRFGLADGQFEQLAARSDLIVNVAASVKFRQALDAALAVNAFSLSDLAALAVSAGAPLVHVSTCYVNGFNRGRIRELPELPARLQLARAAQGCFEVGPLLAELERRIRRAGAQAPDAAVRERRLLKLGMREARRYGWNDTYTFTKWLGEQIALKAMQGGTLTIVRPSIIESTLLEPAPGWIEGVKVADAVILAYARGRTRLFPAKLDGVIDIIPADLVANSILLASVEALADRGRHRVYQCCSGARNPIRIGELVRLVQEEAKRNWRSYDDLFHREPKKELRVVSHAALGVVLLAISAASGALAAARQVLRLSGLPLLEHALRTTRQLIETFSFYSRPLCIFDDTRLVSLRARFGPEDAASFPIDAQLIDWPHYVCRVHLPGLNRHVRKTGLRAHVAAPAKERAAYA